MTGRFITFEGGEGAGKSTQIVRLGSSLMRRGITVVSTREPGGSPYAEAIRGHLLAGAAKPYGTFAEALLFSAARLDHLKRTIRPALAGGAFVLCDRFADSTTVYQGALGSLDPGLIAALNRVVVEDSRPDLTLVLDVSPETSLARAERRRVLQGGGIDRFEAENVAFHARLREAYRALAEAEPQRCVLLDAERDADLVEKDVWQAVAPLLAAKASPEPRELIRA